MKWLSSKLIVLLICASSMSALSSAPMNGQAPPVGIIDFYGLRSLYEQHVRQALQIQEGDALPDSREEIRRRLEALPNVQLAHLGVVCCEAGKLILYVGISEKGAPSLQFRSAPQGTIRLPGSILQADEAFSNAIMRAAQKGDVGEDYSQGHALSHNPEARAIQEQFLTFATQNIKLLRRVLVESSDAHHRALAARIIAYAGKKRDIVQDLVYGMGDPDAGVRNNAMRALGFIARLAQASPEWRINVPAQPFIEMLNSIEWTDRNKSSLALLQLTEKRDAAILSGIRQRALQSIVEMSRWKSPGHAYAPFFILGRIGNISERGIQEAWSSGNRDLLIETALKNVGSKQ